MSAGFIKPGNGLRICVLSVKQRVLRKITHLSSRQSKIDGVSQPIPNDMDFT